MGSCLLLIILLLSVKCLLAGHILIGVLPWMILGIGAYFRPNYPWGPDGPR